jgi:hypothetical protein
LVHVIDDALPENVVAAARRAIARLGGTRFRESYFTTFWLADGAEPRNPVERAVRALRERARPRGCSGAEWWIGRSYTTAVPIEFHFDQDVKGRKKRHPRLSSVFFFNRVRGGQLAVTDARPGSGAPTRMTAVTPRRNRYAIFAGDLLHGVLDARGRTPKARKLPGPRGRLRVTLVVNFWGEQPSQVPAWAGSGIYRSLGKAR